MHTSLAPLRSLCSNSSRSSGATAPMPVTQAPKGLPRLVLQMSCLEANLKKTAAARLHGRGNQTVEAIIDGWVRATREKRPCELLPCTSRPRACAPHVNGANR